MLCGKFDIDGDLKLHILKTERANKLYSMSCNLKDDVFHSPSTLNTTMVV